MPYLYANPRAFLPPRAMGVYRPSRRVRAISPRQRLRGLGFLGAAATLSPQDALTQAISATGYGPLNPRDFQNSTYLSAVYASIQAGQFNVSDISPACAGIVSANPDLSLTQAVGKVAGASTGAIAAAAAGTAAGTALGIATLGIGVVVAVLSIIFAHHAAAVAQEQQIECTVTTAANNAMNVLAEGVSSGQIAPADAATALNTIYSQYKQMAAPSFGTSPYCNANCELELVMYAMVLYWQSQYNAMAAAQAASSSASSSSAAASAGGSVVSAITAPVTNAVASVAASTGIPSWVFYLGGAFLLYELVS